MFDLSPDKVDEQECLTGEEILPSNQKQVIEQAKFTYSPLGKTFEKQIKSVEGQGEKQVDALKSLKPEELEVIKDNKSGDNEKLLKYKHF